MYVHKDVLSTQAQISKRLSPDRYQCNDDEAIEPITRSLQSPIHASAASLVSRKRKEAGLTQAEVATRLKRPQSFVAEIERGQRRLDIVEFVNFAGAIGYDPVSAFQEIVLARSEE